MTEFQIWMDVKNYLDLIHEQKLTLEQFHSIVLRKCQVLQNEMPIFRTVEEFIDAQFPEDQKP